MREPNAEMGLDVGSRISWGAIASGVFIALVSYLLLSALGAALATTMSRLDSDVGSQPGLWQTAGACIALLLGGLATTKAVTRESRGEAVFYGIVLWGVLYTALFVLTINGLNIGLNNVMGVDVVARHQMLNMDATNLARQMGLTPDQIAILQQELRYEIQDHRTILGAWQTFAGILISLCSTIIGALLGFGSLRDRRKRHATQLLRTDEPFKPATSPS